MTKKTSPAVPGFEGKRRTALGSLRAFCVSCMAGQPSLVAACPSGDCLLFHYRSGEIEEGADRRLTRIIKSYCSEQCLPAEDPAGCTANKKYLEHSACALWPFRRGRNPYYGDVRREKLRQHAITTSSEAHFAARGAGTHPAQG